MAIAPKTLLVVNDLNQSERFYTEHFDATVLEQYDNCLKLDIGGHQLLMFQGDKMAANYDHGYHASSTLVFSVAKLDQKMTELKANGVRFIHSQPNENIWGRYAAFYDPSGIVCEIMEYK